MIRNVLPHPLQSCALLLVWLLLNDSVSAGHLLLGALLAIALPLWWQRFWPHSPKLRKPSALLKLTLVLLGDIVVANFQVALQVLGPNARLHPRFFELPLDLDDELAITLLASVISLTPGTVSADVILKTGVSRRRVILVHALDARDPQQLIETIKRRYEQPLKEAFGC